MGWVIDAWKIPETIIEALNEYGITLQPLSFKKTGSISSNPELAQLLDSTGKILDVSQYFQEEKGNFLELEYPEMTK